MANEKPAFPCVITEDMKEVSYGMDLHDWFAGQALNALYKQCVADGAMKYDTWRIGIALEAYAMADAMMEVRNKPKEFDYTNISQGMGGEDE